MNNPPPTTLPRYQDAIRWIYERINYERVCPQRSSAHFCLERIETFLSLVGSPQQRIPVIHIAGTKGKGSTAAILDSILRASGIRSGLFTSPHMHRFEERMRVDGQMPSNDELAALVVELQAGLTEAPADLIDSDITYFEVATLLAWMFFDRKATEYVVLETGLGGRLDCTNVCQPLVTIITNIGLDHTRILGDTVDKIAFEKAGIIKPGVPVLTWTTQPEAFSVIRDRAKEIGCPLFCGDREISVTGQRLEQDGLRRFTINSPVRQHDNLVSVLRGDHQTRNAALAVAAADLLSEVDDRITCSSVARGIATVVWPLRFEVFDGKPTIVLDAAHNPHSVDALVATLKENFSSKDRYVLIFASSRDKDARRMLEQLCPEFDRVILTEFQKNPRAADAGKLAQWAREFTLHGGTAASQQNVLEASTPDEALRMARIMAGPEGLICGTGSIFLAAEIQQSLLNEGAASANQK